MTQTLGERLKKRRKATGITYPEITALAGISKHTVWNIEKGTHNPGLASTIKLASALRCSPSWLAFGSEDLFAEYNRGVADTIEHFRRHLDSYENCG